MIHKIMGTKFTVLFFHLLAGIIFCSRTEAQNLVQNGSFSSMGIGWTYFSPAISFETNYTESTYGGPSTTNIVGEVDQASNLRQTDITVIPGKTYYLSFRHCRRTNDGTPNPCNVNVKLYNGNNIFINQDIVSSNIEWLWQCKTYLFTPTTTTVTLDISNTTLVQIPQGTLLDDITITPVTQELNVTGACLGGTATLSAPANSTELTYANFMWSGPNGFSDTGSSIVLSNLQNNSSGVYTCSMTINNCIQATGSYNLQPAGKPDVLLVNSLNQLMCNNSILTLALANPAAANTYQWYNDNGAIPGATNSTLIVNAAGNFKVIAMNPNGCTDTSKVVNIKSGAVEADFNFSSRLACVNDTVQFTNLSSAGQYQWSFGDQSAPDTTTNPLHIYENQSNYTVKLIVSAMNGCVDSALKIVDVRHPLHAAFNVSADTICQNATMPVAFTNTSAGNITTWNWNFGIPGSNSTSQNPSFQYTDAGTYNVRLIVGDAIPCYDTAYHSIKVDSVPYFSFEQDKHAICTGEAISLTPTVANTADDIHWNFGDGTLWNYIGPASHSYDEAGLYAITATADFGVCGIITIEDSVVVNAFPTVDLGPDTMLCLDGQPVVAGNISSVTSPGIQYLWNTGATTPTIEIVHPGIYSLTARMNGCATTEHITVNKDCYTDVPNVFSPNNDGINDYFYPRQLLSKGLAGFTMTIFDRWGVKIFTTDVADGRGWDGKFNGKNQPMGVYIFQINALFKNGRREQYTGNVTLVR